MQLSTSPIPLSLYIHFPWCIRKCPYCDFNSHQAHTAIPEEEYINALIADLRQDIAQLKTPRPLRSIFMGGGTPSLFSGESIARLLLALSDLLPFEPTIEITLEANPSTVEQQRFKIYRQAGINRLSIGVQSFNNKHLSLLGRVHDATAAQKAIETAQAAGFTNINLDIMYGLPNQTVKDAISDIATAIRFAPNHISWYQLTIEPNTIFNRFPPQLPDDDTLHQQEIIGKALLAANGYENYEISAYCKKGHESQHNLNYWLFGDYLGIGAGAHSKLTELPQYNIIRTHKMRQPKDYLDPHKPFIAEQKNISGEEIPFEFMLNALRLSRPLSVELFAQRTGRSAAQLTALLAPAIAKEFVTYDKKYFTVTATGSRFLNDLTALFLPEEVL